MSSQTRSVANFDVKNKSGGKKQAFTNIGYFAIFNPANRLQPFIGLTNRVNKMVQKIMERVKIRAISVAAQTI